MEPGGPLTASAEGKAERVRGMFDGIAPRYDLLNRVLSLGLDRRWRHEAATLGLEGGRADVLDVATGTGDLALKLRSLAPFARVTGLDFSPGMIRLAEAKAEQRGEDIRFITGDAQALPFADASFDLVTIAYGLRNLELPEQGMSEFHRVLRPAGRLVVLEFPPPPKGVFGRLVRSYFRNILPRIGGLVSGSRAAYTYLPESVVAFSTPQALAAQLRTAGFDTVRFRLQSMGLSAVHVADRAAES